MVEMTGNLDLSSDVSIIFIILKRKSGVLLLTTVCRRHKLLSCIESAKVAPS